MKYKLKIIIVAVQLVYLLMLFGNGIGKLNVLANGLGYIAWGLSAIINLILSIFSFNKISKEASVFLLIISCLEIGFTVFIYISPYIVGIPF